MLAFQQQRLTTGEKDEQWRKDQVDAICSRVDEFGADWLRMWQNYRLKNSQIDQEEYREYCDTLGLSKGEGKKFVEPFNQVHNIIEVLKGEEAKMPWTFGVVNLSPKATNEILREKEREYREYIDSMLELEIEKQTQITETIAQMQAGQVSPEQAEEIIAKITEKLKKREEKILKPQDIEKKYQNHKSVKEKAVGKLLKVLAVNQNLKWMKNSTFEDALVAGVEAVEIKVNEFSKIPYVRQLNVLNLFFHKSPDSPFIQDGDYAGYKEEIALSIALDQYGDELDETQLKRLKQYNSKIFGTDTPWHSLDGESASKWDNRKQYEYTYRHPMSTIPSYGTTNVLSDGLYATDRTRYKYENYVVVYTSFWKSQRRVGKLTYIDEYGKPAITIVSEDYYVPERAVKKSFKNHTFSKTKTKWEWEAEDGSPKSLEWIWIPEIWKGVRINGDIYVKVEPYENAYQSILDPYKVKLPIHGYVYGNRNAYSVSILDRAKPWQKLYYIIMSKWLKLITQDKGVIQLLNVLMLDKKLGYERAIQIGIDEGVLPYNPLAHTQGLGGVVGQMRASERLDLSNSQQLTHYTNILQFVENELKKAAGVTDARLAQTGSNTNVTDNQRDMSQSMNITNSVFAGHELLWEEILQTLCETTVKTLNTESGFIRQVLSDDEIALIDLKLIDLADEYVVKVGNNTRNHQILQEAKGYAQALIQNDKVRFSTLLDLLDADNLVEFKEELRGIENEIEEREIMMQKQAQEHEAKMQEQLTQQQEAERQHRLAEIELKGEYDILGKQISSMAWDPDKDRDRDGMPDILEIEQFRNQAFNEQEKLNLEKTRLAQEDLKIEQKQQELEMKERQENANRGQSAALDTMKIQSNERIAKIKERARPKAKK